MTLEELKAMAENLRYKDDDVYEPLPEVVPTMMSEEKRKKDVPGGLKKGTNDNEEPEPIEEPPQETREETPEYETERDTTNWEIVHAAEWSVWGSKNEEVPDQDSDEYITGIYLYLLNESQLDHEKYLSSWFIQQAQRIIEKNRNVLGIVRGHIDSGFGERDLDGDGVIEKHGGIDINVGNGDDDLGLTLSSVWHGAVDKVSYHSARGHYIDIRIDAGPKYAGKTVIIRMEHLNGSPPLSEGTIVFPGLAVGEIGNSGPPKTATHLHLEVLIDGVAVNPLDYPDLIRF